MTNENPHGVKAFIKMTPVALSIAAMILLVGLLTGQGIYRVRSYSLLHRDARLLNIRGGSRDPVADDRSRRGEVGHVAGRVGAPVQDESRLLSQTKFNLQITGNYFRSLYQRIKEDL